MSPTHDDSADRSIDVGTQGVLNTTEAQSTASAVQIAELESLAQDFDFLADADPMYAVLHEKGKRRRRWDPEEFFATGQTEVSELLARASKYEVPRELHSALDFGSGLGRLSRALGEQFDSVTGVDVCPRMVELATRIHSDNPRVRFVLNAEPNLSLLADDQFDLIYTNKVLQHQPSAELVLAYLREFVRVLKPGGLLAAQIPERMSLAYKLFNRRRQFLILRRIGMNPRRLLDRFGLHPVRMIHLRSEEVVATVRASGGRVVAVERYLPEGPVYFATKRHG